MADHSVYMFRLFFRPPVWYKSSLPNRKFAFRSPCLGSGGWSVAILQVRARETGRAFAGVRFLNWIIPTYTNNYMHKELVELLVFTCRRISLYHLTPSLTSGPVTREERFCIAAALPPPCVRDFFTLCILFLTYFSSRNAHNVFRWATWYFHVGKKYEVCESAMIMILPIIPIRVISCARY